jgi:predicted nucleic acid-binding protein
MKMAEDPLNDTNILLRYYRRSDPDHETVRLAVERLRGQGATLFVAQQNFMEFWGVATRPGIYNGFDLTAQQADEELVELEKLFRLLPESLEVYAEWRRLVVAYGVSGAQVHDTHLVATMRVHGLSRILTLNPRHFARYPGIIPIHPQDVVDGP